MGAEADQFKALRVRQPVNQNKIWPDVAVRVILPLAGERIIVKSLRQRCVAHQQAYNC